MKNKKTEKDKKEFHHERARKAAAARWDKSILTATHGRDDMPLIIGDIKIPCFVLSDGRRVLLQRGMSAAIGLGNTSGKSIEHFTSGKLIEPFLNDQLKEDLNNPIKFKDLRGSIAHGYDAKILADICDSVLSARKAGKLLKQQEHIAEQCELLVRGFAKVGIIALIDEATGYQADRAKDALSKILEAFIAKELQPWVKTFPADYYKELFRLRDLIFPAQSVNNPYYFGTLTNNIIYKRLAPGVLEELKKITPKNKNGRPAVRYFQSLTPNTGYLKLREHLSSVIAIMKLSNKYEDFIEKLDLIHPKQDVIDSQYNCVPEDDIGTGI